MNLKDQVMALHEQRFGRGPENVSFAPGRINLIGEHTDYSEGYVMPLAIDRGVWVASHRAEGKSELYSESLGDAESFDAAKVTIGHVSGWGQYAAGMAWALREARGWKTNICATVLSNLPMGSGVSSSAAIEMSFGRTFEAYAGESISATDLAVIGKRCENQYVGVQSGIMDQMASACGRENSALLIDTRPVNGQYSVSPVRLPDGVLVYLLDTQTPRELTAGIYNARVESCRRASEVLGVSFLRDATLEQLLAKRSELSDEDFRRARHVVTENARALAFVDALANNEPEGVLH